MGFGNQGDEPRTTESITASQRGRTIAGGVSKTPARIILLGLKMANFRLIEKSRKAQKIGASGSLRHPSLLP
jgi:hypothetical protein